jgi:hypothetical protein
MRFGECEKRRLDSCHSQPPVVRGVGEIVAPSSRNDSSSDK